jgi:hypothetical protein
MGRQESKEPIGLKAEGFEGSVALYPRAKASWFYGLRNTRRFLVLLPVLMIVSDGVGNEITFDDPFPDSSFKKVLRLCAQTWELFDLLGEPMIGLLERPLLEDAVIGRLTRLQLDLTQLVAEQGRAPLLHEDGYYIYTFIEKIADMRKDIHLSHEATPIVTNLMHTLSATTTHLVVVDC